MGTITISLDNNVERKLRATVRKEKVQLKSLSQKLF